MMVLFRLGLSAFGAAGLVTKLIVIAGLATSVLAAYGVWHHKVYSAGYARAIADVAAQDKRAIAAAQKGRTVYRECVDAGRPWDVSTGTCGRN